MAATHHLLVQTDCTLNSATRVRLAIQTIIETKSYHTGGITSCAGRPFCKADGRLKPRLRRLFCEKALVRFGLEAVGRTAHPICGSSGRDRQWNVSLYLKIDFFPA
jgi:hypothetical protein